MQSLRSFLIVFSLELLLRAVFLLKSAFHCFILLLGIKFSSESESDEWPCKGPGRSRTGIRSLIRLGEERRGEQVLPTVFLELLCVYHSFTSLL